MKRLVSFGLSLVMVFSLAVPVLAVDTKAEADTIEKISAEIDTSRFTVEYVDEVPSDVTPLKFDNWEDAANWINGLNQIKTFNVNEQDGVSTHDLITSLWPDENYDFKGDVGSLTFSWIPDGAGSHSGTMEYEVPGLSAQKVTAKHYFEYSNGRVTDWSVYTDISGLGLATYSRTYEKLERHDVSGWRRYFGVCVGNLGYYLEISGVPVGVYEALELTYVLSEPT